MRFLTNANPFFKAADYGLAHASGSAHVGVADTFAAKGAFRAVAWNEHRVVTHGPQTLGDAIDQVLVVAARKIGAANAACKQHIADKRTFDLGRIKHHMAWRVPRAMAHLQGVLAEGDGVAVVQPTCGREGARRRKTIARSGLRQTVNPKLIALMWADDGQVQALRQFSRATCMVDVGVGDPNLFQRDAQLFASILQRIQIATGINDGGFHGFIAPDDGTVLLERGDWDGFVMKHFEMLIHRRVVRL